MTGEKGNKDPGAGINVDMVLLLQATALKEIDERFNDGEFDPPALRALAGELEDCMQVLRDVVETEVSERGAVVESTGHLLTSIAAFTPAIAATGYFAQNSTPIAVVFGLAAGVVAGAGMAYGSVKHVVPRMVARAENKYRDRRERNFAPFYTALEERYNNVREALGASDAFTAEMDEEVDSLLARSVTAAEKNNEGCTVYYPSPDIWKRKREP